MEKVTAITYLLCPKCQRTVPAAANERFCPNDGSRMLSACLHCGTTITSPYSRFCTCCGKKLLEGYLSLLNYPQDEELGMTKPTAYFLVSGAIVLWGLGSIFTKNLLEVGMDGLEIAFWRLFLSGVLFCIQALFQQDLKLKATKDLWQLTGFAVFIIALNYLSFNYAIVYGGVSLANLFLATVPMLIAIPACLFFGERLTLRLLGLLALSIIGLLLASVGRGTRCSGLCY